MRSRLVPAVALLLTAAGCGAGGSGSPADAVRSYNTALADADGERACEQLDKDAQQELQESAQGPIRDSCRKVVEALAAFYDDATKDKLRAAQVKAQHHGDRATARFVVPVAFGGPDREQAYELRKVDGDWKIVSLGLAQEGPAAP
jgi:hypothetical protein